ncbi:MAG TPA: DPP IV N-terminal domain-containing protein, partial [Flavisolibacter sp.]|nr:DPP IV N-terminal domain-containing protein [Flavisolibacter sp.]
MRSLFCFLLLLAGFFATAQRGASVSFEKWISLKSAGGPLISPDGRTIVYSINSADWASNSYDSEIWMVRDGGEPFQLTRTAKGSSTAARFTPDSRFVSFLADRGDKTQLYIISVAGGEALQVTRDEDGIGSYEWSPDGRRIAYVKTDPESKRDKTVKERFGAFGVEGEEYRHSHLWMIDFHYDSVVMAGQLPCYGSKKDTVQADSLKTSPAQACFSLPVAKRITSGDFTVSGFVWHPDSKRIFFNRQPSPLILSGFRSDIAFVHTDTKETKTLVSNPMSDNIARIHPDGKAFVYSSSLADSVSSFYRNNRLFIYNLETGSSTEIAAALDENKNVVAWNRQGLFLTAFEKTSQKLYTVDTKTGAAKAVALDLPLVGWASFSQDTDK